MHKPPLVSIALAAYNGEKYLKEQLESIYGQSYSNLEVIVFDDCSSDNTVNILEEYRQTKGLKYFVNDTNLGYVKNFEKAIGSCQGEYIALADQDDIWLENKIETLLKNIGDNLLIHSDTSLMDASGNITKLRWKNEIQSHKTFDDFLFSNVVTGCSVLMKKELLKRALPFAEGLAYHDWYLALCAARESKICYLNLPLTLYRQHDTQDTGVLTRGRFKALFGNKINRFMGKEIDRLKAAKKHLQNLEALRHSNIFDAGEKKRIHDAKEYYRSYTKAFVHWKMFFIGCKYRKNIHFKKNYFCIKNILYDIIG
ncbi:glycosyltransferase family 2 protein [bacterium]|nr:glycosyltransferase family 2 protein [bacterium]MBU1995142.1 glycosyltransferase family 2 protein [bacterium]